MTANDFRKIALSLPEAEEREHMDHPDFRVAGKIFATLGYPDKSLGMVKLSPEDQHYFCQDFPEAFIPVKGGWGAAARPAFSSGQRRKTRCAKPWKPPGGTLRRNVC